MAFPKASERSRRFQSGSIYRRGQLRPKDRHMAIEIRQFPVLSDNYAFLVRDQGSGLVATIDTPAAAAIAREVEASGWGRLVFILYTLCLPFHAVGNAAQKTHNNNKNTSPTKVEWIAPLDRMVAGGE